MGVSLMRDRSRPTVVYNLLSLYMGDVSWVGLVVVVLLGFILLTLGDGSHHGGGFHERSVIMVVDDTREL